MTTTIERDATATTADPPAGTPRSTRIIASALWVFVSGLLAYGVLQTVLKASALFG